MPPLKQQQLWGEHLETSKQALETPSSLHDAFDGQDGLVKGKHPEGKLHGVTSQGSGSSGRASGG